MYQALYRKWRPQTFDDVIGQQHITDSLRNQIISGHLSHAYLFTGIRGTGKTSCARILAKAVNCEHPVNGNPCCECASCRAIADGSVMDIVELDAASNNGVDNVRSLREEAVFSPAMVRKRVYIIDEVHMLSTSAFNALLKILEEPPEHLLFILATTELQKVPATILSRCQRHTFRRIGMEDLSAYLLKIAGRENLSLSPDAAYLLAGLAEGGVRDALSMLDQCSSYGQIGVDEIYASVGLAGNKRTVELFDCISEHRASDAVELFHRLWMEGKDPSSLLKELSQLVRDILMMKLAPNHASELVYGGYEKRMLKAYASRFSARQLAGTMETIQVALGRMKDALDPKMSAELCIISLCDEIAGDTLEGLRLKVASLEEALRGGLFLTGAFSAPAEKASAGNSASLSDPAAAPDEPEQTEPSVTEKPIIRETPAAVHPAPEVSVHADSHPDVLQASAPGQPEKNTAAEEQKPQPAIAADGDVWPGIVQQAKDVLPRDMGALLPMAAGHMDGGTLVVEVEPGFYFTRFNRPEIIDSLSKVASGILGFSVKTMVREKNKTVKEPRSLDELRQYKEVRFV